MSVRLTSTINFPEFTGARCLMMPYIQGDPDSVPDSLERYAHIIRTVWIKQGDIGFLTIDESPVQAGKPHRGARARWPRALHTEVGRHPNGAIQWGGGGTWGGSPKVTLDRDVVILLANNLDESCALWDAEHEDTSLDGDIGDHAAEYPLSEATVMLAGDTYEVGIFTPHESLPVKQDTNRQFLRIVSSGVHGREKYFTINPRF